MGAQSLLTLPQAPPADQVPPEIRETVARYRINLSDGASYVLSLRHGRLSLEDAGGEADCVVSCARETFRRVLNGEANLLTAFMRGDAVLSGDLASAKRLYRYLRLSQGWGGRP